MVREIGRGASSSGAPCTSFFLVYWGYVWFYQGPKVLWVNMPLPENHHHHHMCGIEMDYYNPDDCNTHCVVVELNLGTNMGFDMLDCPWKATLDYCIVVEEVWVIG